MQITRQWLEYEWPRLIADAELTLERTQLLVVRERQPDGAAECCYRSPSMSGPASEAVTLIRRIERIAPDALNKRHHVVAVWEELPDADEVLASALLRHELEHAHQWEQWGVGVIDELDPELKAVLKANDGDYHSTPVERGADDAARDWTREQHGDEAVAAVSEKRLYWDDVPARARAADLLTDTAQALRAAVAAADDAARQVRTGSGDLISIEEFITANSDEWLACAAEDREAGQEIEFIRET